MDLAISTDGNKKVFLSAFQMAVGSNDGYAFIDAVRLDKKDKTVQAKNYDAGTEENTELGSGFDGGQPDPSRGAANVANGTPTLPAEEVKKHDQLIESIMEVVISPKL